MAASFRCAGACKPGMLIRAEKTPDGMKGILVSYAPDDTAAYAIKLDAQGKDISRERLRARRRSGALCRKSLTGRSRTPRREAAARRPRQAVDARRGGPAGRRTGSWWSPRAGGPVPADRAAGLAVDARAGGGGGRGRAAMPEGYTEPIHDADVRLQTDGLEHARG